MKERYSQIINDYANLKDKIRTVAQLYLNLLNARGYIDQVEFEGETIHFTCTEYCHGAEYADQYSIPSSRLWKKLKDLEQLMKEKISADALVKADEELKQFKQREVEALDRRKKQYEKLKEEFK